MTEAGNFFRLSGHADRAEAMYREALATRRELYGDRHPLVASGMMHLALLFDQQLPQRRREADSLSQRAVELLRAAYPKGHTELATALRTRSLVLNHQGRFEEAQVPIREALAISRRLVGPNALDVAAMELDLSYALTRSGSFDEAASLARDAARIFRGQLGDDNGMVYHARTYLGDALRGQGKYAEAEPLLLAAYRRFANPSPATRAWQTAALAALVRLYEAQGRADDAATYRALLAANRSAAARR